MKRVLTLLSLCLIASGAFAQPLTISPTSANAGGAAFTLTVTGSGFVSNEVVYWNSTALVTTFVNSGKVTAAVPASLIATAGFAEISTKPGIQQCGGTTFVINPAPVLDTCGYPITSTSNSQWGNFGFQDTDDQKLIVAGGVNAAGTELIGWYTDETAMILGVRQVNSIFGQTLFTGTVPTLTESGPTAFEALGSPFVSVGYTGAPYANDSTGRPVWPALFITPQTGCVTTCTTDDWQSGHGAPLAPTAVYGTFKSAVSLYNSFTKTVTIIPDPNPGANGWSHLPDTPPGGFGAYQNEGFGTEVVWNLANLGLAAGTTYRFQFMVHDGDQLAAGGDATEYCTSYKVPGATCGVTTGDGVALTGTAPNCVCPSGTLFAGSAPYTVTNPQSAHLGLTYCTGTGG